MFAPPQVKSSSEAERKVKTSTRRTGPASEHNIVFSWHCSDDCRLGILAPRMLKNKSREPPGPALIRPPELDLPPGTDRDMARSRFNAGKPYRTNNSYIQPARKK